MSSVVKAADIVAAPVEWPERGQPSAAAASAAPVGVEPPALLARTLLDIAPLQAEAMRRASQIVEHARQQADDIVQGAHAAREAVLEEAHSEGYEVGRADGYEAGATAAQQEARARLEALASLLDELGRTRDEIAMRYEEDIVQLALAVAARSYGKKAPWARKRCGSCCVRRCRERAGRRKLQFLFTRTTWRCSNAICTH